MNNKVHLLDVAHVSKNFDSRKKGDQKKKVLEDISFSMHHGERLVIVGASGCGKSTLLRMIAGLDEASVGDLFIEGAKICGPGKDRGFVFQKSILFPWLSIKNNISISRRLRINMFSSDEEISRVVYRTNALIALMGLERAEDLFPKQISGGMQQRVSIARALVSNPKILLMDEPFSALDTQTKENLYKIVNRVFSIEKTSVILVTHDVKEAVILGDRIIVLAPNPGRIDSAFTTETLPRDEQGLVVESDMKVVDLVESIRNRIRSTTTQLSDDDLLERVAS